MPTPHLDLMRRVPGSEPRRLLSGDASERQDRVLQTSRDPAQLSLFPRTAK